MLGNCHQRGIQNRGRRCGWLLARNEHKKIVSKRDLSNQLFRKVPATYDNR
jgi:hypothetical protein